MSLKELQDTHANPADISTNDNNQLDQTSQKGDGTSTSYMTNDDKVKIIQPDGLHTAASLFSSGYFPRFKALEEANLKYLLDRLTRQSSPYDMQELGNTLHQYS